MSEERSPYYDITLKINEKDITQFLTNVTYLNNITFIHPIIKITLKLSSSFPELQFIYERARLKLIIEYTTEDRIPIERIEFNLLIVSIESSLSLTSDVISSDNPASGYLYILCVPQEEAVLSSTLINYISRMRNIETPIEAFEKIILSFFEKSKVEINFDKENINTYIPEEVFVPIMPFSRVASYIDNHYGLYKGAAYFNMKLDSTNGKVFFNMYDLSIKFNPQREEDLKIIFISLGSKKNIEEAYKEAGVSDKIYYTRSNLQKSHSQYLHKNSNIVYHKFLIKDSHSFISEKILKNSECLKNVIPNFRGELIQLNPEIPLLEKRIVAYTDNENTDYINSLLFKKLLDRVEYIVSFDRNIRLKKLLSIGLSVKLEFLKEEEKIYGGLYITKGVKISFDRKGTGYFFGTSNLVICRPYDIENPEIKDNAENFSDENVKVI